MELLRQGIADRDVRAILEVMFTRGMPELRPGFFREDQWWDYKEQVPGLSKGSEVEWAKIAADVLAFHNQEGGVIFFGIRNSDFSFVGTTQRLDTKLFNDKLRKYTGDKFWVSYSREFIGKDQRYLGVAIVPPKSYAHQRVQRDSPLVDGKAIFKTGDLCVRLGDETKIFRGSEAIEFAATRGLGVSGATYAVDEANFRVLRPDYKQFVRRKVQCSQIEKALQSQRTFVTSLTGIGGVGKTALACWMTLKAYEEKLFDFIVSVSARDRAFTTAGIVATVPTLSSLEDLLQQICETTGFTELLALPVEEKIERVKKEILQFRGFLFVDNLETVDDPLLFQFLEDLPLPTKALVTSRKAKIRVANYPIEVGSFSEPEAVSFLGEISQAVGKDYLADLVESEKKILVNSCERIPLVIEWLVGRAKSAEKALGLAEGLAKQGRHGEELLEFSFRRVYEEMTPEQRSVLHVLSLTNTPLPIEAVSAGAGLAPHQAADVIEELKDYSLIERVYDTSYRDLVHSLLAVTGAFVYREVSRLSRTESTIRKRLSDWYLARDVQEPVQRAIVQQVRRGERNPELALLQIAKNSRDQKDLETAEIYFKQALERNPRSWVCHREAGEFYRHDRHELAKCLYHYERAAEFCPKQGPDRALIFREWGLVLRSSGRPTAHKEAAERLNVALSETPNDYRCRHALGDCYVKDGVYELALEVLQPLENHKFADTRRMTYPLLEQCYRATSRLLELAALHDKMAADGCGPNWH
jgi:tetratricopeptide (TPR) repeat protein